MKKLLALLFLVSIANAGTYTDRMGIYVPAVGETGWGNAINKDFSIIDTSAAVQDEANTFTNSNTFSGQVTFPNLTASQCLTLDGSKNVTSQACITPPGNDTDVMYNQGGTIAGSDNFTFNGTTITVQGASLSSATLRQITWSDGTVQVSSPVAGSAGPPGADGSTVYPATATASFPYGLTGTTVTVTTTAINSLTDRSGTAIITTNPANYLFISSVTFADGTVLTSTAGLAATGGGGYAMEPATVTITASKGVVTSSLTVTSTMTVTSSSITLGTADSLISVPTLGTGPSYVKVGADSSQLTSGAIAYTDVPAGATNYIQLTNSLQAGSTFYVSSGTVNTLRIANGGNVSGGSFSVNQANGIGFLDADSSDDVVIHASETVTTYVLTLPPSQSSGTLTNDGNGNLYWNTALEANLGGTGTNYYTIGELLVADSSTTLTKVAPNTGSSLKFLSQSDSMVPTWEPTPDQGAFTYYLSTYTVGAISGDSLMNTSITTSTIFLSTMSAIAADTVISTWCTPSGQPNITNIPSGIWSVHLDAYKSGGTKDLYVYGLIYKNDGSARTLLAQTQNSEYITATSTANLQEISIEMSTAAITVSTSDRIEMVIVAGSSGGGLDPTGYIAINGSTLSRLQLPGNTVDSSNFIPYVGATKHINVTPYSVTATSVTATSATVNGQMTLYRTDSGSANQSLILDTDNVGIPYGSWVQWKNGSFGALGYMGWDFNGSNYGNGIGFYDASKNARMVIGSAGNQFVSSSTFVSSATFKTTTTFENVGQTVFSSVDGLTLSTGTTLYANGMVNFNGVNMQWPSSGTIGSWLSYVSTNTVQWSTFTIPESGGSSEPIAIATGSSAGFGVPTASPTYVVNFDSNSFTTALVADATAYVAINSVACARSSSAGQALTTGHFSKIGYEHAIIDTHSGWTDGVNYNSATGAWDTAPHYTVPVTGRYLLQVQFETSNPTWATTDYYAVVYYKNADYTYFSFTRPWAAIAQYIEVNASAVISLSKGDTVSVGVITTKNLSLIAADAYVYFYLVKLP